jgi:hypothetical protein
MNGASLIVFFLLAASEEVEVEVEGEVEGEVEYAGRESTFGRATAR